VEFIVSFFSSSFSVVYSCKFSNNIYGNIRIYFNGNYHGRYDRLKLLWCTFLATWKNNKEGAVYISTVLNVFFSATEGQENQTCLRCSRNLSYSAYEDKFQHSSKSPAPGRNWINLRQALPATAARILHRTIQLCLTMCYKWMNESWVDT
jgi:hypothetical protein